MSGSARGRLVRVVEWVTFPKGCCQTLRTEVGDVKTLRSTLPGNVSHSDRRPPG
ncbi:hypothetical protein Saa2_02598 [Streptomyces acidiscabies]|nr:hypothetical protein Saa2_02598 [Streptomyces acidiscabies]